MRLGLVWVLSCHLPFRWGGVTEHRLKLSTHNRPTVQPIRPVISQLMVTDLVPYCQSIAVSTPAISELPWYLLSCGLLGYLRCWHWHINLHSASCLYCTGDEALSILLCFCLCSGNVNYRNSAMHTEISAESLDIKQHKIIINSVLIFELITC